MADDAARVIVGELLAAAVGVDSLLKVSVGVVGECGRVSQSVLKSGQLVEDRVITENDAAAKRVGGGGEVSHGVVAVRCCGLIGHISTDNTAGGVIVIKAEPAERVDNLDNLTL